MRGGAHLNAISAAGLTPLGAVISTDDPVRGGVSGAQRFGWSEPFPDPDFEARQKAEITTSEFASVPFEVLTGHERSELVALVDDLVG